MLVRCPDCTTKYEIAASLIPEHGVKVRCPKCKAVFSVSKDLSKKQNGAPKPPKPQSQPKAEPTPIAGNIGPRDAGRAEAWIESASGDASVVALPGNAGPDTAVRPKKKITDPNVARRLARAVIQEVLYGREQERRDALAQDRALAVFGDAVVRAFDVYRERVSPELPGAKATFREALNSILGEGRRVL